MKVILLRSILLSGEHAAALTQVEVDEATGKALIAQRLAALPVHRCLPLSRAPALGERPRSDIGTFRSSQRGAHHA